MRYTATFTDPPADVTITATDDIHAHEQVNAMLETSHAGRMCIALTPKK